MAKNFKGKLVGNQWDDMTNLSSFSDRLVGIEYEVEHCPGISLGVPEAPVREPLPDADKWSAIKDNSLRNDGAEFVSFPLPISQVSAAVKQLFDFKKKHKIDWRSSARTGIHVHVNVRDFGLLQLQNLLVIHTLLEPAMFDYVGANREESIYCVPWYRAPGEAKIAASYLSTDRRMGFSSRLHSIVGNSTKYSALLLAPLTRLGTVEFRMAPTWQDQDTISEWAHICERIISYASKCSTYYNVLSQFENDPYKLIAEITDGLLPVRNNYSDLVTKTGSEILARTMFPEVLEEWVRLYDNFFPGNPTPKYPFVYNTQATYVKPSSLKPKPTPTGVGIHGGHHWDHNSASWVVKPMPAPTHEQMAAAGQAFVEIDNIILNNMITHVVGSTSGENDDDSDETFGFQEAH